MTSWCNHPCWCRVQCGVLDDGFVCTSGGCQVAAAHGSASGTVGVPATGDYLVRGGVIRRVISAVTKNERDGQQCWAIWTEHIDD